MKRQSHDPLLRMSRRESIAATALLAILLFALLYVASAMVESMVAR